ncbi:MAG: BON domain-containing protein [Pseudomonadota bacterium]
MIYRFFSTVFIIFTVAIQGCTTIVDATTKEPITPDPSRRSFGTYIDDKRLQVIVSVNIKKTDPVLRQSHINVTSFNNIILLTGQVPTQELRLVAAQVAGKVTGVRQVYNELQVATNIAFLERTNDTWLNTKVKTTLLADTEISGFKVKVVVEDGVVYLMGLISRRQGDRAGNLASNINGVKEVVRVFEYTDT